MNSNLIHTSENVNNNSRLHRLSKTDESVLNKLDVILIGITISFFYYQETVINALILLNNVYSPII